jgi:Trypsin
VADWDPDSPGPDSFCSGTLIAPTVFLTAAHCTASLEAEGITEVWVTFSSDYDEDATSPAGLIAGTPVGHPEFGTGGASDTHDIAVVLLEEEATGITPAQLPTAGLLDQLKASHQLLPRPSPRSGTGPCARTRPAGHTGSRIPTAFACTRFRAPSILIVSITITGDAMCRATDKTYRLDTEAAREFLANFVTLPAS